MRRQADEVASIGRASTPALGEGTQARQRSFEQELVQAEEARPDDAGQVGADPASLTERPPGFDPLDSNPPAAYALPEIAPQEPLPAQVPAADEGARTRAPSIPWPAAPPASPLRLVQMPARPVPGIGSASWPTGFVQAAIRREAAAVDSSPPSTPEQTPESGAGPEVAVAEVPESGEPFEVESWAWPSDEPADTNAALAASEVGPNPLPEGPSPDRARAEAVGLGGALGRTHAGTTGLAQREGLATAAAPSPPAAPELAAFAGPPTQRAQDILRQVRLHWSAGAQRAVIQLQPAELGRIAIRLNVREGRVHAELRVERAATLEELNATLPELEELFSRHGLASGELELCLGFERGSDRGSNQAKPDRSGGFASAPEHPPRGAAAATASNPVASVAAAPALMEALAAQLGVDTFA